MPAKEWWRICVIKSFEYAGTTMDEQTSEMVFQRIYSTFGSINAYELFPDALPYLKWAKRNGLVCGVLSNADERYGDSILPMLGLSYDELQFQCFRYVYVNPVCGFAYLRWSLSFCCCCPPFCSFKIDSISNDSFLFPVRISNLKSQMQMHLWLPLKLESRSYQLLSR